VQSLFYGVVLVIAVVLYGSSTDAASGPNIMRGSGRRALAPGEFHEDSRAGGKVGSHRALRTLAVAVDDRAHRETAPTRRSRGGRFS
jgi:hypothetical protein